MVFQAGSETVAVVSVDLLGFPSVLGDRARALVPRLAPGGSAKRAALITRRSQKRARYLSSRPDRCQRHDDMIHCHSMGASSEQNSSPVGATAPPGEEPVTGRPLLKEAPPVEDVPPIPEALAGGGAPSVGDVQSVKEPPPVDDARPIRGPEERNGDSRAHPVSGRCPGPDSARSPRIQEFLHPKEVSHAACDVGRAYALPPACGDWAARFPIYRRQS